MSISCGPGGSTGQEIADQINNNTTDISNNAGDIADNTTDITDINNVLPTKMDDGDAFLKTEHTSVGPGNPGQPITLNPDGLVDDTFIEISAFNLIGEYTPAAGAECPVPFANANQGDFWIIEAPQGDEETWEYTFTGDCSTELDGWKTHHGDLMLRGKDMWVLRRRVLDADEFVLKAGDRMQGDLSFDNGKGIKAYNSSGGLTTLILLDTNNIAQVYPKIRMQGGSSDYFLLKGTSYSPRMRFQATNINRQWTMVQSGNDGSLSFQVRDENDGYLSAAMVFKTDGVISVAGTPSGGGDLVTLTYANSHYEADLGNPSTNGYILSSDTSGNRHWIAPPSGGGDTVYWGDIEGTLSNQTDLQSALNGKSNTNHNHSGVYHPLGGSSSMTMTVPTTPTSANAATSKSYVDSKLGTTWELKTGDRSGNEHFGYAYRHAWGYGTFKVLIELRDSTQGVSGSASLVYWGVKYRFFEYTVDDPATYPAGYNPGEFVGADSPDNRSVNIGYLGGLQQDDDVVDTYFYLDYDGSANNPNLNFLAVGHTSKEMHTFAEPGGTPDAVASNYKILAIYQKV